MAVNPPIGDDDICRLDPRVVPFEKTVGWIVSGVLGIASFAVVIGSFAAGSWIGLMASMAVWLAANGALAWHFQRWPAISYRFVSYRVGEDGIEIRRGVHWREVTNVPRARVQHTDVSQGPIERRYGLGTLVVYTAGTDHAKVTLGGLDHTVALAIREQLMPDRGPDAV